MKAVVKEGRSVALLEVPDPELRRPDDVIVQVITAGICRTDLQVASGAIASADPITLGHELCGRVIAHGPGAQVAIGDLVSVDPRVEGGFLGIDRHGVFAERVRVPAGNLWRLPADIDPRAGAYIEPIASALAASNDWSARAGRPGSNDRERWVVAGDNRFSKLVCAVVRADRPAATIEMLGEIVERDAYDVAIETTGSECEIATLIEALRPGGTLVLKTRQPRSVALPIDRIVSKELALVGAHYGKFPVAVNLACSFELGELFGDSYPLARFADAFAAASASEARKVFLTCAA
jgi:L-iditol 2-dehydrogenase